MKQLTILGSTGSIGQSALDIVARFPERYRVAALTAAGNVDRLADQVRRFEPRVAVVLESETARRLERRLAGGPPVEVLYGDEGYRVAATLPQIDTVLSAMVGAAGLKPTLAAIETGKEIALANKETLVMAGEIVMRRAAEKRVRILPVDSEHSAIFQCLAGNRRSDLSKILLTASGGPFRTLAAERFAHITVEQALAHPNWAMGPKITVDSATLMNKGLEVIEAMHLFGLSRRQVEVVVHPQSIVHSMVAYRDGTVLAQMGAPDMRAAIACALSWPIRLPLDLAVPDFVELGRLTFEAPDRQRFPCLSLAGEAAERGDTFPAVLNAANEEAVAAFLKKRLAFPAIAGLIGDALEAHVPDGGPDLDAILAADRWARRFVARRLSGGGN